MQLPEPEGLARDVYGITANSQSGFKHLETEAQRQKGPSSPPGKQRGTGLSSTLTWIFLTNYAVDALRFASDMGQVPLVIEALLRAEQTTSPRLQRRNCHTLQHLMGHGWLVRAAVTSMRTGRVDTIDEAF